MKIGKANYGARKKEFKIKDGDNIYRILPPMGKGAEKGKWNAYYRIEWGFKNSQGYNKPFQDVRVVDYKTKMVLVESPQHMLRESLKARKTQVVAALKANPKDMNLINEAKELAESLKRYNLDSKYYVNAVSLTGEIGLLKLGSKAFRALKTEIDKMQKRGRKGVDPLSVENGRFFNFHRSNTTGNFQDTDYQVTPHKEDINVNGVTAQVDKVHVMDSTFISRLASEAFELQDMYPKITAEQAQMLVDGGPAAVDAIFAKPGTGNSEEMQQDDEEEGGEDMSTPTPTQTVVAQASANLGLNSVQALGVTTPVAQVTPTATVATAPTITAPTTPTVAASATATSQTDEEFLRSIGAID